MIQVDTSILGRAAPIGRGGFSVVTRLVLVCGVFVASFLFRFLLQPELNNDFFMHVVRGRQMMLGELPVRDFVDPGLPMMYVVSAFAEAVGGYSLLSEVSASLIFLALGAVLVFLLATEASRSQIIGLLVTVMVVAISPRLYGYPKIFCYPLAVWALWRYLDRPDRTRTIVLAMCTALAFLFRHDHGVYIGVTVVLTLFMRHWPDGPSGLSRAVTSFALATALLLSPYLLFIQVNGGLVAYLRTGLEFSRVEAARNGNELPRWSREPVRLFVEHALPLRVHVRWAAGVAADAASRAAAEQRHGLTRPDFQGQRTWAYGLEDASRVDGLSIVGDPDIEDTHGIDRSTGEVPVPETEVRFQLPEDLGRLISANALPWLFYLFYGMPLAAIGIVVWRRVRGVPSSVGMPYETEKILALALLALLGNVGLLRSPLLARVGDVACVPSIVGAWLIGLAFGGFGPVLRRVRAWVGGSRQLSRRRLAQAGRAAVRAIAVTAMLVVTCVSVGEIGLFWIWLDRTGFDSGVSVAQVRTLAVQAYRALSVSPPVDRWAPPGADGVKGLTRYIHECTGPEDRLFVSGFFPEVYFYSARRFAGGHGDFIPDFHSSLRDQRLTIARFEQQSVPLVLIRDDLADHAPFVDTYLRRRFRLVPHVDPATTGGLRLFVERGRDATGVYPELNTPCYS